MEFLRHYFVPVPPEAGRPMPPVSVWRCSRCGVKYQVTDLPAATSLCRRRWSVDTAAAQEQADRFLFGLSGQEEMAVPDAMLAMAIKTIRELAGEIDRLRRERADD